MHWLWRAVDQDGFVLDVLVQSRRDKKAAKRLFRKLLKKQGRAPRVLVTDKLKSYAAAKREIMPGVEHRQHKGLNNRAENSHQPTRRRERIMKRFLVEHDGKSVLPPAVVRQARAETCCHIAENERVIILPGLIRCRARVGPVNRSKLVLTNVGNAGGKDEEEALNRDDVNGVDPANAIHIRRQQFAS